MPLIDLNKARELSKLLYPLGEECQALCEEFGASGYGESAKVMWEVHRELAGGVDQYEKVVRYWIEYAKERLAGLVGPMDILKGDVSHIAAYRSEYLRQLRASAKYLKSDGPIHSPQIEPTIKKYVELMPDSPLKTRVALRMKESRREAVHALGLTESPEFQTLSDSEKYDCLVARYEANLAPLGFRLDERNKSGISLKKVTEDGKWALVFVDESRDGIGGGFLETRMAISLPKQKVQPGKVSKNAVATFSPWDLIPFFNAACAFEKDTFSQFCLACDANSFVAKSIFSRIDARLSGQ